MFFDQYVEDPNVLVETIQSMIEHEQTETSDVNPINLNQNQTQILQIIRNGIEMVVLRHRLIDSLWETEILSK